MSALLFLVEDDVLVAMTVQTALEDAGYQVLVAAEGDEALALLETRAEELGALITDVNLPRQTGWEIARRARELRPTLPVIYVTGDSAHEWASHGVPKSVLVEKPFAPVQIVTAGSTRLNVTDTSQLS